MTTQDVRWWAAGWIKAAATEEAKLARIREILDIGTGVIEQSGAMVCEAWDILVDDGVWKAGFASRDEAIKTLGTPAVAGLRRAHEIVEHRKNLKIQAIEHWGNRELTARLGLDRRFEEYLGHMADAAARFSVEEADELVGKLALRRIRSGKPGHAEVCHTASVDWLKLSTINDPAQLADVRAEDMRAVGCTTEFHITCQVNGSPLLITSDRQLKAGSNTFGTDTSRENKYTSWEIIDDSFTQDDPETPDTQIGTSGLKRTRVNDSDTTESWRTRRKKRLPRDSTSPTPGETKDAANIEACSSDRGSLNPYPPSFTSIIVLSMALNQSSLPKKGGYSVRMSQHCVLLVRRKMNSRGVKPVKAIRWSTIL
ncbi:hypothetical protein MMC07_001742 [Pseudocyphellaria aurata]|nr:hypothetical protein [Pseudocyphellaria aurata]